MTTPPSSASGRPGALTFGALHLRYSHRYAAHPVENTLRYFGDLPGSPSEESHGSLDFQSAEGVYRTGPQGLPLPQIPQLPQSVVELTRPSDLQPEDLVVSASALADCHVNIGNARTLQCAADSCRTRNDCLKPVRIDGRLRLLRHSQQSHF